MKKITIKHYWHETRTNGFKKKKPIVKGIEAKRN
jgi:hypothetical protein